MPEDQKGNIPVEEKQPSAVPTENETPESNEADGLPEDASERTKEQFDKLTEHNRQLAEEVRQLKEAKKPQEDEGFDVFAPLVTPPKVELPNIPGLTPNQVTDEYDKLVDKDGYIDEKLFIKELKALREETRKANERAEAAENNRLRDRENTQLEKTYKKFPQLNPNNKDIFNSKFYELVKDKALGQMVRTGQRDILKAAQEAAEIMSIENPDVQKQEVASKKEEQVKQINQTGTAVNRVVQPALNKADDSYLTKQTMAGNQDALLERLRRAGL